MKAKLKSFGYIVLSFLGLAFVVGVNTKPAQNMGLDIFFYIFLYSAMSVAFAAWLLGSWRKLSWFYRLVLIVNIFLFPNLLYDKVNKDWTRLPWVKSEAFNVADELMEDLKRGDGSSALAKLTVGKSCVTVDDLVEMKARPASWRLDEMTETQNITGVVTFVDGKEDRLLIRMEWVEKQWKVDGVVLGSYPDTRLDVDILSYRCGRK